SPEHQPSLSSLSREQVARVLRAWAERIRDLKQDSRMRSAFIFKNQGLQSGAGLPGHVHSQVIALPITPKALKEILVGARAHWQLKERCVFCDIVRDELDTTSRLFQFTQRFVVIVSYAASYSFYSCFLATYLK